MERLVEEEAAEGQSRPSVFFATHPPTAERTADLRAASARAGTAAQPGALEADRLLAHTLPVRRTLLEDELRLRRFAAFHVLLTQLERQAARPGELAFFEGELYRLRGEAGDEPRAIEAYRQALDLGDTPAEAHRNLGLLLARAGDRDAARAALERYLDAQPEAADRAMVRAHLERIR
jgi:tetratricopeptide (TPR) repeat protein